LLIRGKRGESARGQSEGALGGRGDLAKKKKGVLKSAETKFGRRSIRPKIGGGRSVGVNKNQGYQGHAEAHWGGPKANHGGGGEVSTRRGKGPKSTPKK